MYFEKDKNMFKKILILFFGFFLICSSANLVEAEETGDLNKQNIELYNTDVKISETQSVADETIRKEKQSDVQKEDLNISGGEATVLETEIKINTLSEITEKTVDDTNEIVSLSEETDKARNKQATEETNNEINKETSGISMEAVSESKIRTADYDEVAKQVVITAEEVKEVQVEPTNVLANGKSYSKSELRLLSALVYAEAGNQSYKGMLAVANIVLNRAKSNVYSHVDTVKEVIYDKKWAVQFAVTVKSKSTGISPLDRALDLYDNGNFSGDKLSINEQSMKKAIKAAKAALEGENNIGKYLCFRVNSKSIQNSIASKYGSYTVIGRHIFYRIS